MSTWKQEYYELPRDLRWQKVRLQVFDRDEWKCRACHSSKKTLAVHHSHYVRGMKPWEYELNTLYTLCEDCHQIEYEARHGAEQEILDALRVAGVWAGDVLRFGQDLKSAHSDQTFLARPYELFAAFGWVLRSGSPLQKEIVQAFAADLERRRSSRKTTKENTNCP